MKNFKDLPKVSIVIVNFNGIQYLGRTISALKKLTYPNFEIIVTDNGSTDGSIKYIESIADVKLIKSPRYKEKNFACNFAVGLASGEFLLMIDNDLVVQEQDLLEKLVTKFNDNPDTGTIGFCIQNEGESKVAVYGMYIGLFFDRRLVPIEKSDVFKLYGSEIGYAPGPIIFTKKQLWLEVGGYDDRLAFGGDDNDLGMQMWIRGYKNYLYTESVQLHIGMPERTDIGKWSYKFRKMVHAHFYTICKNYRLVNIFIYFPSYITFSLLKGLKRSILKRDLRPILAWIGGVKDFVYDFPALISARHRIQSSRSIKQDIFLDIDLPVNKI